MFEMELNLLALEGPPFSGKTTVINRLRMDHGNQTVVIPEAGEYVGGDMNFPTVPFSNFSDAKASTHFFVAAEENALKTFDGHLRRQVYLLLWIAQPQFLH